MVHTTLRRNENKFQRLNQVKLFWYSSDSNYHCYRKEDKIAEFTLLTWPVYIAYLQQYKFQIWKAHVFKQSEHFFLDECQVRDLMMIFMMQKQED